MAFQTAITVKQALENIQDGIYAIPAIQRNFVWDPRQIEELFDSLLQGYPVGAFLFWRVKPETTDKYRWYGFVRNYSQRDATRRPEFEPRSDNSEFTAVLDGQQRLTALNIGLRGSYAQKLPRLWWNNPDAFPEKYLYYNVAAELEDDELGSVHEFRFMTPDEFDADGGVSKWFKVADVMSMHRFGDVNKYMVANGLLFNMDSDNQDEKMAVQDRIANLQEAVHKITSISYYLEEDQDPDRVLHIFARTNRAGTTLDNSDLLLSIATAQWTVRDAREEVNERFKSLNAIGDGFRFDADFVLKAAFVLSDLPNIGFQVSNFTRENIKTIEANWDQSMAALRVAVRLAAYFGLSGENRLDSRNSLIPVAYYVKCRGLDDSFVEKIMHESDREDVRQFLYRTLVSGVWSRSTDTVLRLMRTVIGQSEEDGFPHRALASELAVSGRPMRLDDDRLNELADTGYGGRAFVLLSMLYPDLRGSEQKLHMDHFFPTAKLTKTALRREGMDPSEIADAQGLMNQLPNLILLPGSVNASKGDTLPAEWMRARFGPGVELADFVARHDLGDVPNQVSEFVPWYLRRRERLLERLRGLIGLE